MVKVQDPPEAILGETENLIQEYWEKIRQSLEADCNKMKAKAEMESRLIVSRAKEEAENIVTQAKQEAKSEGDRILAEAEAEAEEMIRKSQEEIAQTRQQSIKVLGETGTNIKAELERLAAVIAEAETKLQSSKKIHDQETETHSRNASVEVAAPKAPASKKAESAAPSSATKRGAPVKDSEDAKLFHGSLKLEIVPPYNQEQTKGVPEAITRLTNCKIISSNSYISGNKRISTFNIDLDEPVALLKIIRDIPAVKEVSEQRGDIIVTL